MSSECAEMLYTRDSDILISSFPCSLKSGLRDASEKDPPPHLSCTGKLSGLSGHTSGLISKVRTEGKTDVFGTSDN